MRERESERTQVNLFGIRAASLNAPFDLSLLLDVRLFVQFVVSSTHHVSRRRGSFVASTGAIDHHKSVYKLYISVFGAAIDIDRSFPDHI